MVTHELTIPGCYKHFENGPLPPTGDPHRNAGEAMNWEYHQSTSTCAVEWLDLQTQAAMSGCYCRTAKWRPVIETAERPQSLCHFYWWLKYRAQVADVKQRAVLVSLWLQIFRSITCLNEHKSFKTDSKISDSTLHFPFITQHSLQRTIYFNFEDIFVTTRTRIFRRKLQM